MSKWFKQLEKHLELVFEKEINKKGIDSAINLCTDVEQIQKISIDFMKSKLTKYEKQIEDMKNCYNCNNIDTIREICEIHGCKNEDKWELKK